VTRASPQTTPDLDASNVKVAIVASRFNGDIVSKLVEGALAALQSRGAEDVKVFWVGGALELPLLAQVAAASAEADIVVALGCVIQGGTDHYEHVCRATVDGLMQVSLDNGVPVGNGVLTVATLEQANARAGGEVGNKGEEAAIAALEALMAIREVQAWV
jgi:6,7-dimethyl-8-ribityllumazine synthase